MMITAAASSTNHKVYGEAAAILAGDALLTMAFEILGAYGRKKSG